MTVRNIDVCVIGGGIAGLTLAALLRQEGWQVAVLERAVTVPQDDGKSVVLNAAAARTVQQVGVWPAGAAELRQVFVSFAGAPGGLTVGAADGAILGYGVSHHAIRQRLMDLLSESLIPAAAESLSWDSHTAQVDYKIGTEVERLRARVAVVAGAWAGLPSPFLGRVFDYRQVVIAFAAAAENWPQHCAFESFGKEGMVALVPRADKEKPVGVIVGVAATAGRLAVLDDKSLMQVINDEFGGRFGLHSPTARFTYAPQARRSRPLSSGRVACVGMGATTLHPTGAQGLNLGLADANCLASLLLSAGVDRAESALQTFAGRRSMVHDAILGGTSLLALGGHLRAFPFCVAGGAATAILSTILSPWQRQIAAILSGGGSPAHYKH